jgi:hypothetical protein
MNSSEPYNCQMVRDLAGGNTESVERVPTDSAQDKHNFDDSAQHSSPEAQHQLFGKSLYPERIPPSEMEPELKKAIAQIKLNERYDAVREFLKRLKERGLSDRDLEKQLSLSTHHPSRMSADDVSKLAVFTYHTHPELFQDVLAEQPGIVKFLSSRLVGAVLDAIATKWLGNRRYSNRQCS